MRDNIKTLCGLRPDVRYWDNATLCGATRVAPH
jgi:hypothetical protein